MKKLIESGQGLGHARKSVAREAGQFHLLCRIVDGGGKGSETLGVW